MSRNWKFKAAVAGVLLVFVIVADRGYRSFHAAAPAWMRTENRRGAALPTQVLASVQAIFHQLDLEVKQSGQPVESLEFFTVAKTGKQLLVCSLETINNPGFEPASEFPVSRWTTDQNIIGYYLLNGTALNITLKHHPTQTNVTFLVVETRAPLAPGASVSVLRVEQRPLDLRPDTNGFSRVSLPRVPYDEGAIHAVAVGLPAHATLKKHLPAEGAYLSTKDAPLVIWINRRLDGRVPAPSIVFKLD